MFNFFKRRNLDTRLNSTEKTDAKNIAEMTVNQLDSEIRAALNEYKRLVDHKWTLHPAEYGDATLASAEREELHNLLTIRKDIPKYNEYINELKRGLTKSGKNSV